MKTLYEALRKYTDSDAYPFHMPGHKRRMGWIKDPFAVDITEIDGFDNLHCAEGIILEAEKRAAAFAGAEESFFLVNGSTCGILSAVSACVPKNGTILMARNSHKSAYHSVFLRDLEVKYLYPQIISDYGLNGGYDKTEIKKILERDPKIQAVFVTSPTYDGIVSDIRGIAEIVHHFKIPFIVDEAHGAHFGIAEGFPQSALKYGADLVIQSLHKTLPCLTQTAILHCQGNLVDRERLKRYLQIYQTSSPSYVFLAAMDQCIEKMKKSGKEMFEKFKRNLEIFRDNTRDLCAIEIPGEELIGNNGVFAFDLSKLIFSVRKTKRTGKWLQERLRGDYHLELEMASGDYALAMTSVADDEEGFRRLEKALHEIDKELKQDGISNPNSKRDSDFSLKRLESICKISCMEEVPVRSLSWEKGIGKIAGEYAYLYPPGIPLIVPGEKISKELVCQIQYYQKRQFQIQGLSDQTGQTILTAAEEEIKRGSDPES